MRTQTTTLMQSIRVLFGWMLTALILLSASAAAQVITEFRTSETNYSFTASVVTGSDGNIWFIESENYDYESYFHVPDTIGRMTPSGVVTKFTVPAMVTDLAAGPDGNIWFVGSSVGSNPYPPVSIIGVITPQGVVAARVLGRDTASLVAGPDGNLWFIEPIHSRIGRVTLTGVVTDFEWIPGGLERITAGPDGNLWFTESSGRIGRITPTGVVTEFRDGISAGAVPCGITAGPDGNLWFTEFEGNRIGRITPEGVVTEFGAGDAYPCFITAGPDGNLWFTEQRDRIGRITPAGVVTEFGAGISTGASPGAIAAGPDGNLWFAEFNANQLGRITTGKNTGGSDQVWVDDSLPTGAKTWSDGGDAWNWVSSDPTPYSGALAHQSGITAGFHQHYFYGASATLAVVGDTLFTYVYLDPANPPSEVMLQWNDGSWEHRAYWGANVVPFGTDGSSSRRYMGTLPANGQWVRLAVPAADLDLEGRTLNGMAFSLYGGRATFDYASTSPAWVQDALPAGATSWSDGGDTWNWVSSDPTPYSGALAHQSALTAGFHQHYFGADGDTLAVGVGDTLFTYVYLDPANPPSEVMLQWYDGSWEHRAYWGPNLIGLGIDGTVSRRYMGALPATGQVGATGGAGSGRRAGRHARSTAWRSRCGTAARRGTLPDANARTPQRSFAVSLTLLAMRSQGDRTCRSTSLLAHWRSPAD